MKSSIHKPVMRGSSYVCADCGIFLRDVRTAARLRTLHDMDPIKLAAVQRRYQFDPELAKRLIDEDPQEVVSSFKMADKFNDFLLNPKARPDLQTPEAQQFLTTLKLGYHNPKTDPLLPWLTREWKKGRIQHTPSTETPEGEIRVPNLKAEFGPDYEYEAPDGSVGKFHNLSPDQLEHWADWYQSDHPSRKGVDIMQMKTPELHQTIRDWDADMREQAGGAAQTRGNILHTYPDGWTVQQLTEPRQLNDEGEKMGHCIGGYAKAVQNGESLIYSLRDHHNEPHATWEVTPNWYEDAEGKLRSIPNPELGTFPSPKEGTMQQIQGKGNEPPIPEYQKRIKDYYESTMPDWTDRPQWDDRHYDDLSEWLDPEGYNGYISYHPGDYGLEEPKTTYDWPSMTEQAAIGANEHYPENIVAKAVEEDQFHPFAGAMGRAIDQERQEREGNLKYEWNKYFYPEWLDLYETQNPRPQDEDYEHPERGFEDDRYLKDKENWEKQREQAADQELKNYQTEQNSTWGDHLDELEVEIAAQRRRERRIQEGEEGKGGEVIGPEDDADLPYRQSKVYGTHTHWSTGEPCNCTFTDHLDPREFWKTAKTRSLYHGTLIDHLPSIQSEGLMPQTGPFMTDAYGKGLNEPTVHATDNKELARALNAIRWQISNKLGKPFQEVNRQDVMDHGVLLKHPGQEGNPTQPEDNGWSRPRWWHADDEGWDNEIFPTQVEPGDYFSKESIPPDQLIPITGSAMMRVFDRARLNFESPEGRPSTPEWEERTATPMVCETCGDPLYHTKCKRCDWGGWNHAMGDNEAIADPTKELKPGIQA